MSKRIKSTNSTIGLVVVILTLLGLPLLTLLNQWVLFFVFNLEISFIQSLILFQSLIGINKSCMSGRLER